MDPQARTPTHEGRHRPARMLTPEHRAPGVGPDHHEAVEPDPDPEGVPGVVPDEVATAGAAPRLVTLPASLRAADLGVGVRAVRGLLLLAVVGCLALGVRWWWVEQQASAVPVGAATGWSQDDGGGAPPDAPGGSGGEQAAGAGDAPDEQPAADTGPGGNDGADPTTAPPTVIVHVVGEVQAPGVVELPTGSRVGDAVQAAGGFTDAADAGSVNLARALLDGEQVWVGAPGEDPPAPAPAPGGTATGTGGSDATPGAGPALPLDLNTATQAQLEELPGIGPVTAGRILTWRDENGRFTDPTELLEVSGIGERTLEQLAPLVRAGG